MTKEPSVETKGLPCPHGRLPMNGVDGWHHCPHCLGLNRTKEPSVETKIESEAQICLVFGHTKIERLENNKTTKIVECSRCGKVFFVGNRTGTASGSWGGKI